MISRRIVEFCAEEVGRQYANARGLEACRAVPGMVRAWIHAEQHRQITIANILKWGHLIEPDKNVDWQFRQVNVMVGGRLCPVPGHLPHLMDRFIEQLPSMTAEEAYFAFEEIHPFSDGNGRCGKIVFNLKGDTMRRPIFPPNKWGILNP